jgi:predicted ATPase
LCRKLGEAPELPQVLWGLWTFHLVRAALGTARELAEEFVRVAERLPYSGLAMQITLIHLGEFVPAMQHFKKALSLYDPERHRDDAFRYAQNAAVAIQAHAAWAMWFLGEPDQAVERMHRALALAHDLSEPHGLAHVFFFSAILHQLRREKRIAQEHAEAALRIAGEHKLLLYHANALVTRAWARTEPGRHEAIEELRQGLAAHDSTRTELLRPHFLALLVDALGQTGQAEEALRVVEEGLAVGDRNREHYYHAELYRLKGEVLMQSTLRRRASTARTAETCFHRAIQVAHSQNAKSFELRGAMSLARLYRRQDRSGEARTRLAEIYDRFTEGFDTPDLREARALLDDLTAT